MKCADADFVVEREKGGGAAGARSERGGEGPAIFEVARPHVQVIEGLGAGIEIEPMRGQFAEISPEAVGSPMARFEFHCCINNTNTAIR